VKTLNIKDPEAHRIAALIAKETGESLTRVVTGALRDRFEILTAKNRKADLNALRAIAARAAKCVSRPYQVHAEYLYDQHGLPK
jgi:antitoxin VapB